VFYDQYLGQWSTETAPREALVANVDWSVSPNPGLLAGGFDYYPRAEEDWSGQQQEQRSYARDAQGQPVPRFCLTDSWEDLPGTLAGMKAFSTALNTGIVLAPSSSASSAGSSQPNSDQEQNDEARHTDNSETSTSTQADSSAQCSKRTSVGSSAASFEFSLCASGRTSSSSLPSELPTGHQGHLVPVPNSASTGSPDYEPRLPLEGVDKGKTPIRTVEDEQRAALDDYEAAVLATAIACDTAFSGAARCPAVQNTLELQNNGQMHTEDNDYRLSHNSIQCSYIDAEAAEDDEEESLQQRVLRVVNVA